MTPAGYAPDRRQKLLGSEDHYRLLVDGIKDYAIFMLDPTGHIVSWNDGAERIKGYSASEIVGQHFSRFYPAVDTSAGKPAMELSIAAAEGRFEEEGWRVRKDGTPMWANVIITALRDATGTLIGYAKVTRDISEKKRLSEAEAAQTRALETAYVELDRHRQYLKLANEELEGFTYSVSHDLRAPIHHIDGFARLLMEEHGAALSQGAREYVHRIQKRARHMSQLVDDLLNLSQVGREGLRIQSCSLGSLVEDIAAALRAELSTRDVRLVLGQLPTVDCDPGLAKVVFTNLLSNAFKFTRGRAHALVEVGAHVKQGQPVLYVRDNGAGFDLKYADRLFGVFQRLHPEFEGSGVGLATVQRIVHKHGGEVWAESRPNQGATFYFTFGPPPHPVAQAK
ncbi:MAG TPA: PAS domain S-box protein [Gemmatimonadaceae bacterium]|jgi:PAS domain S-box-containing protein|nr:PAS domain S-box protein [Gemmatimonadaceae bacterium]